jgi:hypothetical protein
MAFRKRTRPTWEAVWLEQLRPSVVVCSLGSEVIYRGFDRCFQYEYLEEEVFIERK